jgi:hypothetical protein
LQRQAPIQGQIDGLAAHGEAGSFGGFALVEYDHFCADEPPELQGKQGEQH